MRREDCIAAGDSREDMEADTVVETFWLVANALERDLDARGRCVRPTRMSVASESYGAGVYEAVVTTLARAALERAVARAHEHARRRSGLEPGAARRLASSSRTCRQPRPGGSSALLLELVERHPPPSPGVRRAGPGSGLTRSRRTLTRSVNITAARRRCAAVVSRHDDLRHGSLPSRSPSAVQRWQPDLQAQ